MKTSTIDAPVAWASALLNGDPSNLDSYEAFACGMFYEQTCAAHLGFIFVGAAEARSGVFGGEEVEIATYTLLRA